ncbi:MAG: MarR family winged helix-turn-helix transcriptional regulator [Conexibacteraceae bacterium]|nr:MarR family winged helix-turn-helix transcriptional regulator [Conexibacteraceae bacterium]
MSTDFEQPPRAPMIRLLSEVFDDFSDELFKRLEAAGYGDIRAGHGCVFGSVDPAGSRLTDMAESARMTKQSVGEAVTDLARRGYVERLPDPTDGRVKIIRLTDRGCEAQRIGLALIDEIERDWAERYGEAEIAALRETLEAITARAPSPVSA